MKILKKSFRSSGNIFPHWIIRHYTYVRIQQKLEYKSKNIIVLISSYNIMLYKSGSVTLME